MADSEVKPVGTQPSEPAADAVSTEPDGAAGETVGAAPTGSAAVTEPGVGESEAPPAPKRFKFPTALTVLGIILILLWVASFFIPSGRYQLDPKTGGPIPGTYQELPKCSSVPQGTLCIDKSPLAQFRLLWTATPNGLYGIEGATGVVGADQRGFLYGSAQIFLFVLAVGAFITMTMKTGAIETGIGRLALRYRKSPTMIVIILMAIFALGGTTYGMWEETLGFFALMVPLVLALRYDRLVAVSIIFLGAGTGVLASTVNPFATGVASDAAGISITEGLPLRLAMWIVLVPFAMGYVLWYGNRVRKDPSKSKIGFEGEAPSEESIADVPPLTGRQIVVLIIFALAFLTMIYGFIPWNDVWNNIFGKTFPLPTFGSFYFTEASMLFIVAAVVIGIISKFGEEGTAATIVSGAADFLGAALVIVVARGITVVMKNTFITDTILKWMESAVTGKSSFAFAELAFIVNMPIAFLVPSSSGHAALVMPILAPLSDFAGVARSLAVTAYQSASGFVNYVTPTSAIVMGGLALAKVGYDRYIRFMLPFFGIMFVLVSIFVWIGTLVH
jgi:uncharacterized ion transporter superfamily protein YfcC